MNSPAQTDTRRPPELPELDALGLQALSLSIAPNRIVSAAVQLGVFAPLAERPLSAQAVAEAAGADARAMRMLLDALTGMRLLEKQGDAYMLSENARRYLVPTSPEYMCAGFEGDRLWHAWGALAEAVRSGHAPNAATEQRGTEEFFVRLVRGLHVANLETARRAARVLAGGADRAGLDVLDIGCGSGVWGIAVAEADRTARLSLQDLPAVLDGVARGMVARHGIVERTRFLPGDFHAMDFGTTAYDLAILGNIVHMESEVGTRRLFEKSARTLRAGGRLAIIDMFPNEARTAPSFPLMFALNMLVATREGDTYTIAQLRPWLAAAGFSGTETFEIGHHSPLLVARK